MRTLMRLVFSAVCVLVFVGCHSMDFKVREPTRSGVQKIHDRKAFFLWGLAPTRDVDVRNHCPNGVESIYEETTVGDGLLRLITIGIYAPRSTNYYCIEGD